LRDEETLNFIAFCRYIASNPEDAVKEGQDLFLKKTPKEKMEGRDLEEVYTPFKGYLKPISKENELGAWTHINRVCDSVIAKYPKTMQEDVITIQRNASGISEDTLTVNE